MAKEAYERHAAECLLLAGQATDRRNKTTLIEMANAWLRLAEQAEKNSRADLVYETPVRRVRGVDPLPGSAQSLE